MMNAQDVFVAIVLVAIFGVWLRCMLKGTLQFRQHQAAHHHIVMMNEEVARRWREQELNANNAD